MTSALKSGAIILAMVDSTAKTSEEYVPVVCKAQKSVQRLSTAWCATKKAISAPKLSGCFEPPDLAFNEQKLLNRQSCEARTKEARCGITVASALMDGRLTALYTQAAKIEMKDADKEGRSRGWQPPTGLTCN